jgi:hypothetical protein
MPTDLDELSSHPAILKTEECRVKSEEPDEATLMPLPSLLQYATRCSYKTCEFALAELFKTAIVSAQ